MRDLRRLLRYIKPHWETFTLATIAMVVVGLLEIAIGGSDRSHLRSGVCSGRRPAHPDPFWPATNHSPLRSGSLENDLAPAARVSLSPKGIAEYFSTYLMARIGQSAVLKLRQDLYQPSAGPVGKFF